MNLNDYIYFELTKYGAQIYRTYYNTCETKVPSKMQLWEFMNIFGKYTYIGASDLVVVKNEIKLRD